MTRTTPSVKSGNRSQAKQKRRVIFILVHLIFMALITTNITHAFDNFRFVVMSDSQCNRISKDNLGTCTPTSGANEKALKKVVQAAKIHNPAFVVFAGDMVTGAGLVDKISVQNQLKNWKSTMSTMGFPLSRIMPAWGSHEKTPASEGAIWSAWANEFKPEHVFGGNCSYPDPGKYGFFGNSVYYCDYQNARFFVLNNDIVCHPDLPLASCQQLKQPPASGQALNHQLGQKQLDWVFDNLPFMKEDQPKVYFFVQHEPAYSICAHRGWPPPSNNDIGGMDDAYDQRNKYIQAIMYHATMIFSGHEHVYLRRKINSTIYPKIGSNDNSNFIRWEFLEVNAGSSGGEIRTLPVSASNCTSNLEAFDNLDNTEKKYHYYLLIDVDNSTEIPIVTGKAFRVDTKALGISQDQIDAFSYAPETTVVQSGDSWRYNKGTAEPPFDWQALNFNDAQWLKGRGAFGYRDVNPPDPCGTYLTDMKGNYISLYARRAFAVSNPESVLQATLTMDIDDGFVAYLNEKEIGRMNLSGNPPAYNIPAAQSISPRIRSKLPPHQFPLQSAALKVMRTGKNILAIQGHNHSLSDSSDFYMMPSLRMLRPPFLWATFGEPDSLEPPRPLQGASLKKGDTIYIVVKPETGIEAISYYLKQGGASAGRADRFVAEDFFYKATGEQFPCLPLYTSTMNPGDHSILALVEFQDVSKLPEKLIAQFKVYHADDTFVAYNDLAWAAGQLAGDTTKITSPTGGSGFPDSGELIDFNSGQGTGVTLSVTGGRYNVTLHSDKGRDPTQGDAYAVFNGKVSGKGSISYLSADDSTPLALTFRGLNPSTEYNLVFYSDRNGYGWDRASLATISGVEVSDFTNESSVGIDDNGKPLFSGPTDPSTRLPAKNDEGYVAKFTHIRPGSDGEIQLIVSWSGSSGFEYMGRYANCVMLEALPAGQ